MEESRATIPIPEGTNRVQICVRHSTNLLSIYKFKTVGAVRFELTMFTSRVWIFKTHAFQPASPHAHKILKLVGVEGVEPSTFLMYSTISKTASFANLLTPP